MSANKPYVKANGGTYSSIFKSIDVELRKDAGCSSELDYIEQTSWILFLKYLDDFESDKIESAIFDGKTYTRIIESGYRWSEWAAPKRDDGKIDHNLAKLEMICETL